MKNELVEFVEDRHRDYVRMFCKMTKQKLIKILDGLDFEEVHYLFSNYKKEGAYNIRGIFATLEGVE